LCETNIDDCQFGDVNEVEGVVRTDQGIFSAYGYCGPFGNCSDQINSYLCDCHPGYTGKNCEAGKVCVSDLASFALYCHLLMYVYLY
jgi:hypothetical protein